MPKIAVYAGHGGEDPGATANGLREKDINLAVSNAVTNILRQNGYEVINNRTTDKNRSITADATLANNQGVDAVVEVHMNSNAGTPGSGTETFYSIMDNGKGKALAQAINNRIVALGFKDRGIKTSVNARGQDTLGIIRLSKAPTVLVEMAFINNPQDMARFDVNKMASAIAGGIMQVFPTSTPAPTPVPTPPPPPVPSPGTYTGNAVVKNIQSVLNQRYNANLVVDGVAGAKTKQAIIKGLQTELNRQFYAGLTVDGAFGPATASALRTVRNGMRGNIVYLVQAALYLKGYPVVPDGIYGDKTASVVRDFQRDNGLQADGIAGPVTQTALFRSL